jgi:glycosyltransferase involved in cell wall biosynthesis
MTQTNPTEKTNPLISICIPTFNQVAFIGETLKSCLEQTYSPIEIIVVDDHSSDGTDSIVAEFAREHPAITLIKNTHNIGLEKNWNLALTAAKGDFVKILCGDDLIAPTCIEKQAQALLKYPSVAFVSCSRNIINSNSSIIRSQGRTQFLEPVEIHAGLEKVVRSGTNPIGEPACVLFRRGNEKFDAEFQYMIDLDFWIKLWDRGSLLILEETLASFRIHPKSLTSVIGTGHFQEYRRFLLKISKSHPKLIKPSARWIGSIKALFMGLARNLFLAIFGH